MQIWAEKQLLPSLLKATKIVIVILAARLALPYLEITYFVESSLRLGGMERARVGGERGVGEL